MSVNTTVRARIDSKIKEKASETLQQMGLSMSDAIRLLLFKVASEKKLPFELKAPNIATEQAIRELEAGKGKKSESVDAMFKELDI